MSRLNKSYETEDGVIWNSRSTAVIGIIMVVIKEELYVLLTKRADTMEDMPGRWCMPCGYLDWDETLEEAVERELREETDFICKDYVKYLTKYKTPLSINSDLKSNRQNISISYFKMYTMSKLPEIKVTEETSEVEWCPCYPEELKKKDLVFNHYDLIRNAIKSTF